MKLSRLILALGLLVVGTAHAASAASFTLTSPQVKEGGTLTDAQVFNGFGCTGKNISPALEWNNAPAGTKSFAVTLYDPDAPTGSGWWHWVVFNIPADAKGLALSAGNDPKLLPAGAVQSVTDFAVPGFGGACPPPGDKAHRYIFTVYALDVPRMDLPPTTMPATVGFSMYGHVLGKATLNTTFGR